jgi:hypothetical protein
MSSEDQETSTFRTLQIGIAERLRDEFGLPQELPLRISTLLVQLAQHDETTSRDRDDSSMTTTGAGVASLTEATSTTQ